jgi:hypothetical protein
LFKKIKEGEWDTILYIAIDVQYSIVYTI